MIDQKILYKAHSIGVEHIFERIEPILLKVKNNDAKENPASFLADHMEAIKKEKHISKQNTFNGKSWEVLTMLTLMECGVKFDEIEYQWRPHDGRGADMDLLINRRGRQWMVGCKTSLRERWKEIAYEAKVAHEYMASRGKSMKNTQAIGVFHREKAKSTKKQTTTFGKNLTEKSHYVDLIVSPDDEETFNRCIDCIIKGKSLHSPQG